MGLVVAPLFPMTDSTVTKSDDVEENRELALKAAHRAVQFLESKQATGAVVLLTGEDGVIIWDSFCTPSIDAVGDSANVLGELGKRLRSAWFDLHAHAAEPDLLGVIDGEKDDGA